MMASLKLRKTFRKNDARQNVVSPSVVNQIDVMDDVNDANGVEGNRPVDDQMAEFWSNQCQKYEERIVELHSVIAELTRKLEDTNDVIREESEFDETSVVTDSCLEDEEEDQDVVRGVKTSEPIEI